MKSEEIMDAADELTETLARMSSTEAIIALAGLSWSYYMAARPNRREMVGRILDHAWERARQQAMLGAAALGSGHSFEDVLAAKVRQKGAPLTNGELIALLRKFKIQAGQQ